jgi:hypothetical protein
MADPASPPPPSDPPSRPGLRRLVPTMVRSPWLYFLELAERIAEIQALTQLRAAQGHYLARRRKVLMLEAMAFFGASIFLLVGLTVCLAMWPHQRTLIVLQQREQILEQRQGELATEQATLSQLDQEWRASRAGAATVPAANNPRSPRRQERSPAIRLAGLPAGIDLDPPRPGSGPGLPKPPFGVAPNPGRLPKPSLPPPPHGLPRLPRPPGGGRIPFELESEGSPSRGAKDRSHTRDQLPVELEPNQVLLPTPPGLEPETAETLERRRAQPGYAETRNRTRWLQQEVDTLEDTVLRRVAEVRSQRWLAAGIGLVSFALFGLVVGLVGLAFERHGAMLHFAFDPESAKDRGLSTTGAFSSWSLVPQAEAVQPQAADLPEIRMPSMTFPARPGSP